MDKKKSISTQIHDGGVVEIFACGGQCRGQNHIAMNTKKPEEPNKKLIKVG